VIENQETRLRFEKIMNTFAEVFGKPVTREKNRIYFSFLKRYDLDEIEDAAERIINEKKISTFPTIAEILDKIGAPDEELESNALELWNKACNLIIMGDHESDDLILDRTIELAFGSWRKFGETHPENESFDRNHFVNCYKNVIKKEKELILSRGNVFDELNKTREKIKQLETGKSGGQE